MKTLFLFFALAFLVCAKANPEEEPAGEPDMTADSVAQQAEENGPADDAAPRMVSGSCNKRRGYCFLRHYVCRSGSVFKEEFNDCRDKRSYKCCVP